jgi:glycosyltransferase involved in cell wall biosynthesis
MPIPRVTVLMAVFNGERYLRQAVRSVLDQTLTDFELVIVDDGSNDGTPTVLASFSDSRIAVHRNERNRGLAASLNRGLRLAEAPLVARLDADDVAEPHRLEVQHRFLQEHPDVALVGSRYRPLDASGDLGAEEILPDNWIDVRWALLFYCPFVHSAVMFRTAVIPRLVGLYDESLSYSTDFELWWRVARRYPALNLRESLVQFRAHSSSMTSTYGERTKEGYRLRGRAVAGLLGWSSLDDEELGARYDRIRDAAVGSALLAPSDVAEIKTLHTAFCADFRIGPDDASRHWLTLESQLRHRLVIGDRLGRPK